MAHTMAMMGDILWPRELPNGVVSPKHQGKRSASNDRGSAIPADAFESSALRSVNATPTAARQKRIVDAE